MDEINTFVDLYNFLRAFEGCLIDWLNDPWQGKDKQESLLRLFAQLSLIDKLENFYICNGNFNLNTLKTVESYKEIFYKKFRALAEEGEYYRDIMHL